MKPIIVTWEDNKRTGVLYQFVVVDGALHGVILERPGDNFICVPTWKLSYKGDTK